jgi:glucan biosynthesis protein C
MNQSLPIHSERRYEIDWLRVLAMLTVFLFHNARFFDFGDWHLKNAEHHLVPMIFVAVVSQWIMPLFFLLAGASSRFALDYQTSSGYIRERFKRLIVPFIFGALVLIPPQGYMEALTHAQYAFSGSFPQYYPHHFIVRLDWFNPNIPGWLFGSFGHHLWFLGFLFTYSLLSLPFFRWLKRSKGQVFLERLGLLLRRPGAIFLGMIPIALIQAALRAHFPSYLDVADFFYWLIFFTYGYLIYAQLDVEAAVKRHEVPALGIGIACSIIMFLLYYGGLLEPLESNPTYSARYIFYQIFRSINTWTWLVYFLSLGMRSLKFTNPFVKYANEAVMPFYVFHQTIILIIGFFVISWHAGIPLKFLLISTTSFGITMGLYEFVKRTALTRFLFGMRPPKKNPERQSKLSL